MIYLIKKYEFNLQTHLKKYVMFMSWGSPVVDSKLCQKELFSEPIRQDSVKTSLAMAILR